MNEIRLNMDIKKFERKTLNLSLGQKIERFFEEKKSKNFKRLSKAVIY